MVSESLDLELLKKHRQSGTVLNWHDRRTDLYEVSAESLIALGRWRSESDESISLAGQAGLRGQVLQKAIAIRR